MNGAIIIGGHVQGLGLLRSLGKKGIPVYLIDDRRCIGQYSRYCLKYFQIEDTNNEFHLMKCLTEISDNCKNWLLLPTSDSHVRIIANNEKILQKNFKVSTMDIGKLDYFYNKKSTYTLAEKLGIPYPTTYYPLNIEDLKNNIISSIEYPIILKPAIKHKLVEKTHSQLFLIKNNQELINCYQFASKVIPNDEIMLQKMISRDVRDIIEVGIFFKQDKILASIFIKKFRQIPLEFGTGTSYKVVEPNNELLKYCNMILSYVDYYGICNLEFIMDNDGIYKLIDINPRSFKWHYLIYNAGVNMPYLMYQDMNGFDLPEIPDQNSINSKIKYFDEYPDMFAAFSSIIRKKSSLHEILNSFKGERRYAVASFEDPMPFVMETILLPWIFWKRRIVL